MALPNENQNSPKEEVKNSVNEIKTDQEEAKEPVNELKKIILFIEIFKHLGLKILYQL